MTQEQLNDLQNIAAKLKDLLSSEAVIINLLFRAFYQVSDHVSDVDINELIRLESDTTHLHNDVHGHTSYLNQATASIQIGLDELGKIKTTIPLQQSFTQEFLPLKAEAIERMKQREQFSHTMTEYIEHTHEKIRVIIKAIEEFRAKEQA